MDADLYHRDEHTRIKSTRIHMLRKYFLSQIKTKIPNDVAEAMVGHAAGLDAAYRRYSKEELAKFYKQGESALLVLQDSEKLDQLTDEVSKKDKQLQELVVYNQSLLAKNEVIQVRVGQLETRTTTLETCIKNLPRLLGIDDRVSEINVLDTATIELTPAETQPIPAKVAPVMKVQKRASN
jgi:hypothetical protein